MTESQVPAGLREWIGLDFCGEECLGSCCGTEGLGCWDEMECRIFNSERSYHATLQTFIEAQRPNKVPVAEALGSVPWHSERRGPPFQQSRLCHGPTWSWRAVGRDGTQHPGAKATPFRDTGGHKKHRGHRGHLSNLQCHAHVLFVFFVSFLSVFISEWQDPARAGCLWLRHRSHVSLDISGAVLRSPAVASACDQAGD